MINLSSAQQKIIKEYRKWIDAPENNKYKKWHEDLFKLGFKLDVIHPWDYELDVSENAILKPVKYRYHGPLAVNGDHALDGFMLTSSLTDNQEAILYYNSSFIDEVYMTANGWGLTQKEKELYLNDIQNFIDKYSHYIGREIEVNYYNNHVYFLLRNPRCLHLVIGDFTKLAVLLDVQTTRKFPFCGIKDYESIYRRESDYDALIRISSYSNGYLEAINRLIGSSYSQQREDLLLRVEKLIDTFSQNSQENKNVIKILLRIRDAIKEITSEEFETIKDSVFDI